MPDVAPRTHDALEANRPETARLLTRLQSLGLRTGKDFVSRRGGAGPAEGGAVAVGGYAVMVPASSPFAAESPFELREHDGGPWIFENDQPLAPAELIPRPGFYHRKTADGLPMNRTALLHGRDCLATTVIQTCRWWPEQTRCRFCGIELSLQGGGTSARKSPAALAETAAVAKRLDNASHVVLTTGSTHPPGGEIEHLAACARAVKDAAGLAVHVQFSPPAGREVMERLRGAGVDTVGIHLESWDPEVLARQAPVKAAWGLAEYERAWLEAVDVFGPNQVSSFLIAGLGEGPESLVEGADFMADRGVFPFIVPLRPIPGSLLAGARPPDPGLMAEVYQRTAEILGRQGLSSAQSLAGCVRCGACSALAAYEEPERDLVCHPARTRAERAEAFALRRGVFVDEQGLFEESDLDENDEKATLLLARYKGRFVGAVRVFPYGDDGHWEGGRLAVHAGFRTVGAGPLLVKAAMAYVKKKGCRCFTAHIQEQNVVFFRRLGWRPVGSLETFYGRPHQLMEADLGRV